MEKTKLRHGPAPKEHKMVSRTVRLDDREFYLLEQISKRLDLPISTCRRFLSRAGCYLLSSIFEGTPDPLTLLTALADRSLGPEDFTLTEHLLRVLNGSLPEGFSLPANTSQSKEAELFNKMVADNKNPPERS